MFRGLVIIFAIVANIVGAANGQFPFIVSVRIGGTHVCSGTIISDQWILTAANPVNFKPVSTLSVYVGSNRLTSGGTEYMVDQSIIHNDWNIITYNSDLALLHLSTPIKLSKRAAIASVADSPAPDGAVIRAATWGKYPDGSSKRMKAVTLTRTTFIECQRGALPWRETNMCTQSAKGTGLCMGDSGSPATYQNTVVGVASFSLTCSDRKPVVFTDLTQYVDWIRDQTMDPDTDTTTDMTTDTDTDTDMPDMDLTTESPTC